MNELKNKFSNRKGITLVSLVVTIILLLILAGITMVQLTGSGLFEKTKLAEEKTKSVQIEENKILEEYKNTIDSIVGKENNAVIEELPSDDSSERLYLYNQGNEYEDKTGGWQVGFYAGDNSSVGSAVKYDNYVELKTWGYWCAYSMMTTNNVNSEGFSKLCVEIYDTSWIDISGGYEQMAIQYGQFQKGYYRENIVNKVYEEDISTITEDNKIMITTGNGANVKIKAIWLEK